MRACRIVGFIGLRLLAVKPLLLRLQQAQFPNHPQHLAGVLLDGDCCAEFGHALTLSFIHMVSQSA